MNSDFELVPAIDLREGRCVRLHQGRLGTETVYAEDPSEVARRFVSSGATRLHVVDLDGAFAGASRNADAIEKILAVARIPVQVGGGIRDMVGIDRVLGMGAHWAILGTAALRDPDLVVSACARYPGRIAAGVDARGGRVAVSGWVEVSQVAAGDLAARLAAAGVSHLIYTDIERDGALVGPNLEATVAVAARAGVPVFASGGVSSMEDIQRVRARADEGVRGVVVGRALYTGAVDLDAALAWLREQRGC